MRKRIIRLFDVSSYYPHLMTICGYTSRNIPSPEIFENVVERRMKAKASGDKVTANALKLVVNTTYGAMLNRYNDLYDPLMGRSVCITGQLFLLELAQHLYADIEDLVIVQLNTDGIMIEFYDDQYNSVKEIVDEWQERTGFELEEDAPIVKLAQKDVNNYIQVHDDGKRKAKGGYLVKGISAAGAWKVNESCTIVADALQEFFVNDVPVEETINGCEDISKFQIIAKAGAKYKEAYHLVDGEKKSVQKVNRVYATKDARFGKIYKVKAENEAEAKIESLPDHCLIDNDNELTIEDVDKDFYIEMAVKRVNDFKGIKPEKKSRRKKTMAAAKKEATPNPSTMNVYQKLIQARDMFLNSDVNQSGKNMQLAFKYFELSDIVPPVTRIFREIGLIAIDCFDEKMATLTVINCDKPDELIVFTLPFNQIQPIVSNAGKQVTNDMQALGSSVTYMRRYLYQIAMDICVNDEVEPAIDHNTNNPNPTPATPAPVRTATATHQAIGATRAEVKKELTAPSENASALQIKGLKNVLKKLKDADPSKEEMIAKIAVETQGFTVISKADCESMILRIGAMLEEVQK